MKLEEMKKMKKETKTEKGNWKLRLLYTLYFMIYTLLYTFNIIVEGFFEAITSAFFPSKR